MAAKDDIGSQEPWQRNPWVWLIIAIPALTIAGCLVTVWLAVTRPDYRVADYPDAPPGTEHVRSEPAS